MEIHHRIKPCTLYIAVEIGKKPRRKPVEEEGSKEGMKLSGKPSQREAIYIALEIGKKTRRKPGE